MPKRISKMAKASYTRSKSNSNKKSKGKRAQKRCNYCRNHTDEIVFERGHGTCQYNNHEHFKTCKKCDRNYNKTRIARKFRDKKLTENNITKSGRRRRSGTPDRITISLENQEDKRAVETIMEIEESLIGMNGEFYEELFIDTNGVAFPSNNIGTDLYKAFNQPIIFDDAVVPANTQIDEQPQSGFSLIVMPTNYPNDILYPDNEVDMKIFIERVSDDLEKDNKERLKIQYKTLELGRWKVVCLDEYTRDLFTEEVLKWDVKKTESSDHLKLKVIPEYKMVNLNIKASCLLNHPINGQDFLRSISGNQLDTSRWIVEKVEPFENKFKVFFNIDPKSYRYLYTDAYWLIIRNEYVKINIDSNPFADEHSSGCS
ncbi:uncharacterized protein [Chironomus tepperi]|uniref:uncharacterized protein isoform X1 n=1 Tax=Chironomus tepperi TaxID=113505 RepID=UPI00391EF03F